MAVSAFSFCNPTIPAAVIACLDATSRSREVAEAAADYASWFGRPLVFYHAMEFDRCSVTPPEPLDWHFRRIAVRDYLDSLGDCLPGSQLQAQIQIAEGDWLAGLFEHNTVRTAPLIVIGESRQNDSGLLTRKLLDHGAKNILVVPEGYHNPRSPRPQIVIPVDGSDFAEAALVEAIAIARSMQAELLLVHVMPTGGIERFGPPGNSDLELQKLVEQRNAKAACRFLEATLRRLQNLGISSRSLCLSGDPRTRLEELIAQEEPALVILSTRGQGFNSCTQLSLGSTANYLLDRLTAPMLLVGSSLVAQRPSGATSSAQHFMHDTRGPLNISPVAA